MNDHTQPSSGFLTPNVPPAAARLGASRRILRSSVPTIKDPSRSAKLDEAGGRELHTASEDGQNGAAIRQELEALSDVHSSSIQGVTNGIRSFPSTSTSNPADFDAQILLSNHMSYQASSAATAARLPLTTYPAVAPSLGGSHSPQRPDPQSRQSTIDFSKRDAHDYTSSHSHGRTVAGRAESGRRVKGLGPFVPGGIVMMDVGLSQRERAETNGTSGSAWVSAHDSTDRLVTSHPDPAPQFGRTNNPTGITRLDSSSSPISQSQTSIPAETHPRGAVQPFTSAHYLPTSISASSSKPASSEDTSHTLVERERTGAGWGGGMFGPGTEEEVGGAGRFGLGEEGGEVKMQQLGTSGNGPDGWPSSADSHGFARIGTNEDDPDEPRRTPTAISNPPSARSGNDRTLWNAPHPVRETNTAHNDHQRLGSVDTRASDPFATVPRAGVRRAGVLEGEGRGDGNGTGLRNGMPLYSFPPARGNNEAPSASNPSTTLGAARQNRPSTTRERRQRKHEHLRSLPLNDTSYHLNGRIISGGDTPLPFIGSTALVLGVSGLWLGTTGVWMWRDGLGAGGPGVGGKVAVVIFGYLTGVTVGAMLATALREPGIIPRDLDPSPPISFTSSNGTDVPLTRELRVRDGTVSVKYCDTCKLYRPPRSSHCRLCGNCVEGIDHHCSYLHNCVGRRNYTSFMTFLIFSVLSLIYSIVFSALHYAILCDREGIDFRTALARSTGSAVSFGLGVILISPVLFLLGYHTRLLFLNSTTIEQIRASASKSLLTTVKPPPNPFAYSSKWRNLSHALFRPQTPSWVDATGWYVPDTRFPNPGFKGATSQAPDSSHHPYPSEERLRDVSGLSGVGQAL